MKKYILSFIYVITFTVYAIYQQLILDPTSTASQDGGVVSLKAPSPTPAPLNGATGTLSVPTPKGQYNDGSYTGVSADAFYGNIKVKAVVSGGKLVDVIFLDYPQEADNSIRVNTRAMPLLKERAILAQSANIDGVSGASYSSPAFVKSLSSALDQAKNF